MLYVTLQMCGRTMLNVDILCYDHSWIIFFLLQMKQNIMTTYAIGKNLTKLCLRSLLTHGLLRKMIGFFLDWIISNFLLTSWSLCVFDLCICPWNLFCNFYVVDAVSVCHLIHVRLVFNSLQLNSFRLHFPYISRECLQNHTMHQQNEHFHFSMIWDWVCLFCT